MYRAFILCIIGGFFGFSNPAAHVPILVFLLPLGLARVARRARTVRRAFIAGALAGVMAYSLCLYWIFVPLHRFAGLPWFVCVMFPFALGGYLALYTGLYAAGLRFVLGKTSPVKIAILAGAMWAALETVRGLAFTGFPWLVLSSAFSSWPAAVQLASVIGAYNLSGVLAFIGAWPVLAGIGKKSLAVSGAAFLILLIFGAAKMSLPPKHDSTATIAVVQGNIDQSLKWHRSYQVETVNWYLKLSWEELDDPEPDLFVWPETALPFYFQDESLLSNMVASFAKNHQAALITGAPGYESEGDGEYSYYNRAFLVDPQGGIASFYDKQHLVPFGEYVPLKRWLPFVNKLASGAIGDFEPGLNTAPLTYGDLAMGMLICYETIFPELAQKRVNHGANILVNISNDAWYGRTSAPRQHLDLAVLRTVEQARYMVRCTNTGISALIGPRGRVLKTTPLFESATFKADVGLVQSRTLFNRAFVLMFWLPIVVTGVLVVAAAATPKPR